jgi:hypothetical protein
VSVDLLGVITDEQGRAVGRIRDEMQIPTAQAAQLASRQLQYQSGVTLPAGHFKVKVAVRENTNGAMGTFEFPITIPDLKNDPLKVSPIVLSTQLRFARGGGPGGRGGPGGPEGRGPGGFGGPGGNDASNSVAAEVAEAVFAPAGSQPNSGAAIFRWPIADGRWPLVSSDRRSPMADRGSHDARSR